MEYDIGVADVQRIIAALRSCRADGFEEYALTSFTHRVFRAMELLGIRMPELLVQRLLEGGDAFYSELVHLLVPPTTELFRDPDFWIALRDEVLLLAQGRGGEGLRIWIASFDSGEELYSLCLLLDSVGLLEGSTLFSSHLLPGTSLRMGLRLPARRLEQDRSNAAIVLGEGICENYLEEIDEGCNLTGRLVANVRFVKQRVRFTHWEHLPVQIVLCRNQLIYCNIPCGNANLDTMAYALDPGGILALGIGENLASYQNGSKFTVLNEGESIYRRLKM